MLNRSTITTLLLSAALGLGTPAFAQPADQPKTPDAPKQVQPVEVKDKDKERDKQPEKKPEAKKKNAALSLGDPAPALQIEKWIKGDEVKSFEPGKVYVVEFWATWCPPCNEAFPHLSELQAKFKDKGVTFIGVDVAENYDQDNADTIAKFVADKGDKMAYTVAYDGSKARMNEAYMTASGQQGIPCAFIVNQEGKIAWIGHPNWSDATHEPMEAILGRVVEKKYDLAVAQAKIQTEKDAAEKIKSLQTKLARAKRTQKWDEVDTLEDELIALDKAKAPLYVLDKFNVYVNTGNFTKVYAMKEQILSTPGMDKDSEKLNEIAWRIVDPEGTVLPKNRDLDFALIMAQKADEAAKHEFGHIIDTVARVYWEKGDKQKALQMQEEAVRTVEGQLKAAREANNENDIAKYEEYSVSLKNTLQEYKRKIAETTG